MHRLVPFSAGVLLSLSTSAFAQTISRQQAVDSALTRGGRLAVAIADTAAASSRILAAGAFENPSFSATYSKSAPQLHFTVDVPIPVPGLRSARIASAQAGLRGATYRLRYEKAAIRLAADTAYTRVIAAAAKARLTARNALVADTLVQMTIVRRNAGDASELEVEMARVNAGQQHNLAIADSVELAAAVVDLQSVMGLSMAAPTLLIDDSIALPDTVAPAVPVGTPLQIAAAVEDVSAASGSLKGERRSAIGAPSLMGGFETRDPSEKGLLPTFGVTVPLPLLNRNQGGIATAKAELQRSKASLALARVEYQAEVSHARRERSAALARVARDRTLLAAANRVAQMSITAYKAGAMALPNVFEAQRNARDVLRDLIDDLSAASVADARLRLLTLTTAQ